MELTVTLGLPHKELSPNGRYHWRAKAPKIASYRKESCESAILAVYEQTDGELDGFPWDSASIEIRYFNRTARVLDPDNVIASMKPAIDGLTDAGVLSDDRAIVYRPPVIQKDADWPRVELVIKPMEPKP